MDTDQDRHFVGPDLGPDCLQRLSADNTSRQEVTFSSWTEFVLSEDTTAKSDNLGPRSGQNDGPDLGPDCLQRLSADDTSRQDLTSSSWTEFVLSKVTAKSDNLCKQFRPRSGQNVGSDLGPDCLQRFSADDTSRQELTSSSWTEFVLFEDATTKSDNLCKQFGPRSGQNVGSDLGPDCLQRFSADDTSRQELTSSSWTEFVLSEDATAKSDNLCKQFGPRSGQNVGPDLGQNCLQRLSADDTSRQELTFSSWIECVIWRRHRQICGKIQ